MHKKYKCNVIDMNKLGIQLWKCYFGIHIGMAISINIFLNYGAIVYPVQVVLNEDIAETYNGKKQYIWCWVNGWTEMYVWNDYKYWIFYRVNSKLNI